YQEACKQAAAFQRFLPRRNPTQGAAAAIHKDRASPLALLPNESEIGGTRSPTCGSCFSLRSPRLSGPDSSGPLRAAPSGERRGAPQSSVSGAVLLTLPLLQGAAAPSEGSLGPLVQVLPAGKPFQDTVLAAQTTPEASLERLVPLVDHLAAWKLLPNVSAWVLRTVERGYRIQFGAPPPPFSGVCPMLVGPEQGLVMEQEVISLLRKEAIEVVPPHETESGFYSRYFIVPKKDGGLRPILDLRLLNRSVMRLKFKMLTISQVVSQIRSEDWFVTIDLKDAYFHVSILPHHRKFLSTFTKCVDAALAPLRLQGIRILNYIDDWLILAQCRSRSHERAGVKTKRQEKTTYLGVVFFSPFVTDGVLVPCRCRLWLA
ncbi:hypothetical protein M9458_032539, partial [Cirrhinus mrigala]